MYWEWCVSGRRFSMERGTLPQYWMTPLILLKLSEALGAKAIRVTKMEDVEPALKMALAAEGPVVLDCWIDQDLSVFPMVPAGANLDDVFDEEDMKKHE